MQFVKPTPQDMIDLSEVAYEWMRADIIASEVDVPQRLDVLAQDRASLSQLLTYINSMAGTWDVIRSAGKRAGSPIDNLNIGPRDAIALAAELSGFPLVAKGTQQDDDRDGAPRPQLAAEVSTG